jgi:superfamily II DNA or RNA helicase
MATHERARTSLSARGYSILKSALNAEEMRVLTRELTMAPVVMGARARGPGASSGMGPSFKVFSESANKVYLPKCFALKRFGLPVRDVLSNGAEIRVDFVGALRPEQRAPADAFLAAARDPLRTGGIISLPCGGGKTITALHIAATLGRKTLIIVHKEFLLNQWRERIAQFLPTASVGLVKAQVIDVEGRDIVLASLQSLSMKSYPEDLFVDFGLMIIDECHRVGTEVFSRALMSTCCRYTLGLSATVQRKDGMTKAFTHFLGDVIFKGKRREDAVRVERWSFHDSDPAYCEEVIIGFAGSPNVSRMINNICDHQPRTRMIVRLISSVLEREPMRKVLVLSDRKSQLRSIKAMIEDGRVATAGFYWGGMKPDELAESEKKTVMCATFSYAAEGMDVPDLDTLVLASPKSDIEQSCGRILRQKSSERDRLPLIIDIVDTFSLFYRQALKRKKFYATHKYRIADMPEGPSSGDDDDDDDCPAECLIDD